MVVTEAEAEAEEKMGEAKAKKIGSKKIEPLKTPILTSDASYINADNSFNIHFMPIGLVDKKMIGYIPMLIIEFENSTVMKALGYTDPLPKSIEIHTCGKSPIDAVAESKERDPNKRRVMVNKVREMLKVNSTEECLQPKLAYVMVALTASTTKTSALTIYDLCSPMVFYPISVRHVKDNIGTLNIPRAACRVDEVFDTRQKLMERAIPFMTYEVYRFSRLTRVERRGCLNGIPLLHNCLAELEFVDLFEADLPLGVIKANQNSLAQYPDAEHLEMAPESENAKLSKNLMDELLPDIPVPKEKEDPKPQYPLGGPLDLHYTDPDELPSDDEDPNAPSEFKMAENGDLVPVPPHEMTVPDIPELKDVLPEEISDLFKAARGGQLPNEFFDGDLEAAAEAEAPPAPVVISEKDLNNMNLVDQLSTKEAKRRIEMNLYLAKVAAEIKKPGLLEKTYLHPLSSLLSMLTRTRTCNLRPFARQRMFEHTSAHSVLNFATLSMLAASSFIVPSRYVEVWSRDFNVKERGVLSERISAEQAVEAIKEYRETGNCCDTRLRSGTIGTGLDTVCVCRLGDEYPNALGFIVKRRASAAADFKKQIKWPLRSHAIVGLEFCIHKTCGEFSGRFEIINDETLHEARRYWTPLLPEAFWRVARVVGFRTSLMILRAGAIDDARRLVCSPAPHLLVFSRRIVTFGPMSMEFVRANETLQKKIERQEEEKKATMKFKKVRKDTRASVFDVALAESRFCRTVDGFRGVEGEKIHIVRVRNDLIRILNMMAESEQVEIMANLARLSVKHRPDFKVEHLAELFFSVSRAFFSIDTNLCEGTAHDLAYFSKLLVRDRDELELFYPKERECCVAVTALPEKQSEKDTAQQRLIAYDEAFSFDTKNERWRSADYKSVPVETSILQIAESYDFAESVMQCITSECFEFGADIVRCDSLDRMNITLVDRIYRCLFGTPTGSQHFHLVFFPDEKSHATFTRWLKFAISKNQSPLWSLVVSFFGMKTMREIAAQCQPIADDLDKQQIVDKETTMKRKAFVYFARAEMFRLEAFHYMLCMLTHRSFEELYRGDLSWRKVDKSFLPNEQRLFDAIYRPSLCDTIVADDVALAAILADDRKRAIAGDYLYVTGLALHCGSHVGAQVAGPSIFEDLFFSCNKDDCLPYPDDFEEFVTARNVNSRLRCWFDRKLQSQLVTSELNCVILPGMSFVDESNVPIKFSATPAQLKIDAQLALDVGRIKTGSRSTPINVWFESKELLDGTLSSERFGLLRGIDFDIKIDTRNGQIDRKKNLCESAEKFRFIFADSVPGSPFITFDNPAVVTLISASCQFEHKRFTQLNAPPVHRLESDPSIAPSAMQLMSDPARRAALVNSAASNTLEQPSERMLFVHMMRHKTLLMKSQKKIGRLASFRKEVSIWKSIVKPRQLPMRGFCLRDLIALTADRPAEVVVAGGSWEETRRRCFETRFVPNTDLLTNCEIGLIDESTLSLGLQDCYMLNFVSGMPFFANVCLSDQKKNKIAARLAYSFEYSDDDEDNDDDDDVDAGNETGRAAEPASGSDDDVDDKMKE
jgi:hypothetical protein